jgi:protein SCO1
VYRPIALAPVLAALTLSACSSSKPPVSFEGALLPPGVPAHPFTLTSQSGRRVSLQEHQGHVRLLAFLSASQRSSLLVAQQIRGALDELGRESEQVATLIVSTDVKDTRAQIERFLSEASLAKRIVGYLSGPPSVLRAIWKAYGIVPASAGEAAFFASTPILLVDRAGVERVGFPVEQLTPETLAHDLRLLLEE